MDIKKGEIIGIIRGVKAENVLFVVDALMEEGIRWIEVSLSEEEKGLSCIREIVNNFRADIRLGVGTVIKHAQVDKVIAEGAKYIITPGWDRDLVRYIKSRNIDLIPGVCTPSEIMQAINEEIEIFKLFPAGNLGINYVKSLFGPFPGIHIMAVGGINKNNIMDFYRAGCSSFAIGSELVPKGASREDISTIKKNAKEIINIIKGV